MTHYKGRLRSKTFKRAFPHIVEVAVLKKRPMCGRFTNRLTWREIVALYQLTAPATPERNLPARSNICPTKERLVLGLRFMGCATPLGRCWSKLASIWTPYG